MTHQKTFEVRNNVLNLGNIFHTPRLYNKFKCVEKSIKYLSYITCVNMVKCRDRRNFSLAPDDAATCLSSLLCVMLRQETMRNLDSNRSLNQDTAAPIENLHRRVELENQCYVSSDQTLLMPRATDTLCTKDGG